MGASANLQVFAILQCLDIVTTLIGLRQGAHEANGIVAGALGTHWLAFIALKLLFAGLVITFLIVHGGKLWARTIHGVNTGYAAIVGWNLGLLAGAWHATFTLGAAAFIFTLPWIAQVSMEITRRHVDRSG